MSLTEQDFFSELASVKILNEIVAEHLQAKGAERMVRRMLTDKRHNGSLVDTTTVHDLRLSAYVPLSSLLAND